MNSDTAEPRVHVRLPRKLLAVLLGTVLAACGGGGGGGGGATTPDTTPPTVSSTAPASGATGVDTAAVFTVTFSEAMSGATLSEATFTLSGGVTGTVSHTATAMTFTPSSALAQGATYTATVTTGVKDAAGNAMTSPHSWTFTTGAALAGALDLSFGVAGRVVTSFGDGEDEANAVAIQPDGKIVVGGLAHGDFGLARYDAGGNLDPTFSGDGRVATFILGTASYDVVDAVAIQPDGKIVAAGASTNNFAVARYLADGSLDTTFDADGKATSSMIGGYLATTHAYAVALQPDGKIVVAGSTNGSDGGGYPMFALARFTSDGALDTSFGGSGVVTTAGFPGNGDCVAHAVAVQPDGKIVAAGSANGTTYFALTRYDADGNLDASFGVGGRVSAAVPYSTSGAYGLVLQPDGKLLAAGNVDGNFAVYRFDAAGNLETIFDRTTTAAEVLRSVALQPDGKLVAAGYRTKYQNVNGDFVLRRYLADGSFDLTFGTDGRVVTPVGNGFFDGGHAVALQADGRIVVVGVATNGVDNDFVVARYWP